MRIIDGNDPGPRSDKVHTKDDFVHFLNELAADFDRNTPEWENRGIHEYLEAIAAWTESTEVPQDVNWAFVANIFIIGKIYE